MTSLLSHRRVHSSFLLAALALGVACGDPNSPQPGTEQLTPVSDAERTAAIAAAESRVEALASGGTSGAALNAALAAFLATRPEFSAAGVDTLTSTVWGAFRDGRVLMVVNNRLPQPLSDSLRPVSPQPSGATGVQALDATELPAEDRVRLLHSFGPGFDQVQAPVTDIGRWLDEHGYEVAAGNEGDARVETLRNVRGDGFFYLNTHGGKAKTRAGDQIFAVQTSSIVAPEKDRFPDFKDDLENGRLVYMTAPNGGELAAGIPDWDTRYAITYKFVERYMSFGKNSIVFLNVCHSAGPHADIAAFVGAMHAKGAGVYLGWTSTVSTDAAFSGVRYFVDRLLGANEYRPENPKQRAFAWPQVMEDMARKGLATDAATGAQLVARPAATPGAGIGLLNPSIAWVSAAGEQLFITGLFGERPATGGVVTIDDGSGAIALAVQEWTPTRITTGIPKTGAGSVGDVVVKVREHESNPRRLNRWTGLLRYTLKDAGSLTIAAEMEVNVRMDAAPFRDKPGEAPGRSVPAIAVTEQDSKMTGSASGTYVRPSGDCTYTNTWSGSVSTTLGGNASGVYALYMEVDPQTFEVKFTLASAGTYTSVFIADCNTPSGPFRQEEAKSWAIEEDIFDAAGNRVVIPAGSTLAIPAGKRERPAQSSFGVPATATLEWAQMTVTPAYDPTREQ